jgi:molybdopterin molybdotransferase
VQVLGSERVNLWEAAGRVLAAEVVAPVRVPSFDRAAMDGFALRAEETFGAQTYNSLEFAVVGVSLPGRAYVGTVSPGQAVRVMTGAPLPEGTDAVIPAECSEMVNSSEGLRVRISDSVSPGRHVGHQGEDIEAGSRLFEAGRTLRPQDVGVLASIGESAVTVVRRPTVAIFATGDELLPCGTSPIGYQIVDSNSVMLDSLVRRDGGVPAGGGILRDRPEALREAVLAAGTDVILISGGTSVGQEDHAPAVLAELGELSVHGVALRPASPTGVGFLGERPVFLLPGNPVSCLCAYDLFAGPTLRRLGGRPFEMAYRTCALPLARKISSEIGRVDYVRVTLHDGKAEPLATGGASILSSTTRAAGFVLVARDGEGHAPGEVVRVYLYD